MILLENQDLREYTSFGIGGVAKKVFMPESCDELTYLVKSFEEKKEKFLILGKGTNVLFSGDYLRQNLIVMNKMNGIKISNEEIYANAGAGLEEFIIALKEKGLSGMEELNKIPGSIGGAVYMNAGAYGKCIFDFISEIEIFIDGRITKKKKEDVSYAYRKGLHEGIIIGVGFDARKFTSMDKIEIESKMLEIQRKREENLPWGKSAGCVFKNPSGMSAKILIKECGLLGTKIGDAFISEKHGNYIVNEGRAKAEDVRELILLIKKEVFAQKGVMLDEEIVIA